MGRDEMFAVVKQYSKASELHEVVATYRAYRDRPDGQTREVLIEVLDAHDTVPAAYRWSLRVTDVDTGPRTRGNSGRDLPDALLSEQWHHIDRDSD